MMNILAEKQHLREIKGTRKEDGTMVVYLVFPLRLKENSIPYVVWYRCGSIFVSTFWSLPQLSSLTTGMWELHVESVFVPNTLSMLCACCALNMYGQFGKWLAVGIYKHFNMCRLTSCSFWPCRGFEEQFEILLTGVTGGAVLGHHLVSKITITRRDSPFGVVRFLNQSKISIPNPNSTMVLHLVLERTGRLLGEIQVESFFLWC